MGNKEIDIPDWFVNEMMYYSDGTLCPPISYNEIEAEWKNRNMTETLAGKPYSECSTQEIQEDLYDPDTAIQEDMEQTYAIHDMWGDHYYKFRKKFGRSKTRIKMLELFPDCEDHLEDMELEFSRE